MTLDALFAPRAIAVAGAGGRADSMGSRYLRTIAGYGFRGGLFAVNRDGAPSGDIPGYRHVSDIPEAIDLCLIAVPAAQAIEILADCAAHGVKVAQILSSGFAATGPLAIARLLEAARGVTRIVGPNCLGTHNARARLTFVSDASLEAGSVAIVSQSGGLGADALHHARLRGLGLGKVASIGDCVDLEFSDFLAYLEDDPETAAAGLYIEGSDDRRFFERLRSLARRKPVVVLKGGRTAAGALSVASHTGALAGDYQTWQAALAQAGATEVRNVDDMLATLAAFQSGVPQPKGARVALIGNGGGMTVLATDALADEALELPTLDSATNATIASLELPAGSSIGSALDFPVGALSKMDSGVLRDAFSSIVADSNVDLLIAHFNLSPFVNYSEASELTSALGRLLGAIETGGKPLYVALRGSTDPRIESYRLAILSHCVAAKIPCFADALEAVRAAGAAHRRVRFLDSELEGDDCADLAEAAVAACSAIFAQARLSGRTFLTQLECFGVLDALGIERPFAALARNASAAAEIASLVGAPVALKIDSPDIVHKSDAGGVRLNLPSPAATTAAFEAMVDDAKRRSPSVRIEGAIVAAMAPAPLIEAIAGFRRDRQFGAVVLAGAGGTRVEIDPDVALRIAPVGTRAARAMWRSLRARRLFEGYRGAAAADTAAFERIIVRLSQLAVAFPEIAELDLNPVMLYESGAATVDCRIRIESIPIE